MSTSKEFKYRTEEENVKILEKALNSGRVTKEAVILWIYNKARKVKKNYKGKKETFNLHHLKALLNKSDSHTLSKMYVKMKLVELNGQNSSKKKWKRRKIPGLNS